MKEDQVQLAGKTLVKPPVTLVFKREDGPFKRLEVGEALETGRVRRIHAPQLAAPKIGEQYWRLLGRGEFGVLRSFLY